MRKRLQYLRQFGAALSVLRGVDLPVPNADRRLVVQRIAHLAFQEQVDDSRSYGGRTMMSPVVQVFGRRHDEPFHALWRPASKKRQGTKSREVGHRRCSGRYGDLMAAPSWRVDVTPTGRGRRICTLARLEGCNRHLGKRLERIKEHTVRRAQ